MPILHIELGSPSFTTRRSDPSKVATVIAKMLATLGIEAQMEIGQAAGVELLSIDGCICRFPTALVNQVEEYVRFVEQQEKAGTNDDLYWELLITNILWLQPQVLFPDECAATLTPELNSLPSNEVEEVKRRYKSILVELLHLKISLTNKSLILDTSRSELNYETIDWNKLREDLIVSCSRPEIILALNEDYFNDVIIENGSVNPFESMRDDLFYATGLTYPPIKILFDPKLHYNHFYLKFNEYETIPCVGLVEQVLVNETPDKLKLLNIEAAPTVNPATHILSSVISIEETDKAKAAGLIAWNELGYLTLCCKDLLSQFGYLLIDRTFTISYLDRTRLYFSKIAEQIQLRNLLDITTKILRLLARERVSIRNARVLLEAILDADYIVAESSKYIIFDERVPVHAADNADWHNDAENIVEFVRTRMREEISFKYTKAQGTLSAYLLDPTIEDILDGNGFSKDNPDQVILNKICEAVDEELGGIDTSLQPPVVLTNITVRAFLRRLLELQNPEITVVSYQELTPNINIQPLARISLKS